MDFSMDFVSAALSPAATLQSKHMSYAAFNVCHKKLKWSRRIFQADNVGVGAPGAFIVASKWITQSAVAINRDKADFADVAMTENNSEF